MIQGFYDGLHFLDLLSSFSNVAWGAQHGNWESAQDDPLYSALSHFKSICYSCDIKLEYPSTWANVGVNLETSSPSDGPFVFVISGDSIRLPVEKVLEFVENGSNLVVLHAPHAAYNNRFQKMLEILDLSMEQFNEYSNNRKVEPRDKGRVFFINGDEISDGKVECGPFGPPKSHTVDEAQKDMKAVAQSISTFAIPFVDCAVRSVPASWPLDETLVVEVEVTNKSLVDIELLTIEITLPAEFEPLSNKDIEIQRLISGTTRSIATLAVPRKKGVFENPVKISAFYAGNSHPIFLPQSQVVVLDNLQNLLRTSQPKVVDLPQTLPQYEQYLSPVVTSSIILQLLDIDPDGVVSKVRRVGEHLSKSIAKRRLRNFDQSLNFAAVTKELYDRQIISPKAKGYIDTIRIFGNMASHADPSRNMSFGHADALVMLHALLLFLKEIVDKDLLK